MLKISFGVATVALALAPAMSSGAGAEVAAGTAAATTSSTVVAAAVGGDGATSTTGAQGPACQAVGDGRGTQVLVELAEYSIAVDPVSAPAGKTTFRGRNQGAMPHEFVVVKGDDPAGLPVEGEVVDEDALPSDAFVGEVEEFRPDSQCPGTFDLKAGSYVLFCNLPTHYRNGMYAGFTVTPVAGPAPDRTSAPPAAPAPTPAPIEDPAPAPVASAAPPPVGSAAPPAPAASAAPTLPTAEVPAPRSEAATAVGPTVGATAPATMPRTGPNRLLVALAGAVLSAGGVAVAFGRRRVPTAG